ncbi:hypothetical protein GQS52_25780 [Streptomyces sp. SCUT-3]|uniref:acetoacetate decarboxylase family protein n=1 Tax=Streptomyces sp. SCUT-3 TaxID=2684469 RepID=UPI0015FE2233|nr:acetoacetate decarboxylase family protein [Streptomyces sp. SCUT-3]QMV24611.1 hypothetical protein GQS52_25780 [Streptomyces sp. SCUT-3]
MSAAPRDDRAAGPSGVLCPAEPWRLVGSLVVSFFRVPAGALPDAVGARIPAGARPVTVAGSTLVAAAFAHYAPGGVLQYDELLTAVPVRYGRRLAVTVPHIWVDSPQSRAGGRELWAIPKDLAVLTRSGRGAAVRAAAYADGAPIASLRAEVGARLPPGRWGAALTTLQRLGGQEVRARSRAAFRPHAARVSWSFAPSGPLGHLAGRRPWLSLALEDASVVFGTERTRRAVP